MSFKISAKQLSEIFGEFRNSQDLKIKLLFMNYSQSDFVCFSN